MSEMSVAVGSVLSREGNGIRKKRIALYFPGSFWLENWIFSLCNILLIRRLRKDFDQVKIVRLRQRYFGEFLFRLIFCQKSKHTVRSELDSYCEWLDKEGLTNEITLVAYSSGGYYARFVYNKCPTVKAFIGLSCIFDIGALRTFWLTSWFVDVLVDPSLLDDRSEQKISSKAPVLAYYGRCEGLGPLRHVLFDSTFARNDVENRNKMKYNKLYKKKNASTSSSSTTFFQCVHIGTGTWVDYLSTNHWLLYILAIPPIAASLQQH